MPQRRGRGTRRRGAGCGATGSAATRALPSVLRLLLVCAAWLCVLRPPLQGQTGPVHLYPGHWAWDAVRRLEAAGVAPPAADRTLASITVRHARAVFTSAGESARRAGRPELAALAEGYARLLAQEADSVGRVAGLVLRAGWAGASGEALAGDGYFVSEDWQGARPVASATGPVVAVRAHGHLFEPMAWSVDVGAAAGEFTLRSAALSGALGPFDLWVGRRRLQYGIGRGGGMVLGAAIAGVHDLDQRTVHPFDGGGIEVRDPFRFPAFLRFLGPARIEVVGGRLPRVGGVERPWVVFGRLTGHPFSDRITLGINRGAIFGGDGIRLTPGRLFGVLYGAHGGEGGEFENQVFSTLASIRPPLGDRIPLLLYIEWGMDDTSGAVSSVPGVVVGADLGAVPGLPRLAVGVERTSYAQSCCGNPIWYRHVFYRGSWAVEGRLLAHPLGGHGRELLAHARYDLPERGLLVSAEAFQRQRYHENLFAPERHGPSIGGRASLEVGGPMALSLRMQASHERAEGWRTTQLSALVSRSLRPVR
jgi:hypothetical protein